MNDARLYAWHDRVWGVVSVTKLNRRVPPTMKEALETQLQKIEAEIDRLRRVRLQDGGDLLAALKASRDLERAAAALHADIKDRVLHRGSRSRTSLHHAGSG
ncbi:MAG: hypothetical protein D6685_12950 [Bacteroidetes bacterium]|nr:hypothetical protein AWN76_004185 [Rhodothermaceae bacterium RA]RMH56920.1 MAG: hypothetical protein D6685_12950 [Bacteroidota bacterium]